MRFFTSDHHYYHKNVILYCGRPYNSVEEMNVDLINKWNSVVSPGDEVYYLGDFSLSAKALPIVSQLSGKKILIAGNHDLCWKGRKGYEKKAELYREAGFHVVLHLPDEIVIHGERVLLWHLPYLTEDNPDERYKEFRIFNNGQWLLHGHSHGYRFVKNKNMIDVGVDCWNGFPVSETEIGQMMADPREQILNPKGPEITYDRRTF
jgi:calcineurin-like phosphoesterase family protein